MTEPVPVASAAKVALVPDALYRDAAKWMVRHAIHRCLCSLFIVDPAPLDDVALVVDDLLQDLSGASWRGVDARLIVGGSRENPRIADACLLGRSRARALGVDARLHTATKQRSDHAKVVVADDHVLLGSHNWSPGALGGEVQDSVMIKDVTLSSWFATRFEERWRLAQSEGFDVPH